MIPLAIIQELCTAAGIDHRHVSHIDITPQACTFTVLAYNEQGQPTDLEEHTARICNHPDCTSTNAECTSTDAETDDIVAMSPKELETPNPNQC